MSLSSAEAEFFGAMMCARDLVFIRDLLLDFGFTHSAPSPIYSDSKSAVDMSYDPVAFKKTKHIMRAAAFLRDLVERQVTTLLHISGTRMLADMLTKAVSRAVFVSLIGMLDDYDTYRRAAKSATPSDRPRPRGRAQTARLVCCPTHPFTTHASPATAAPISAANRPTCTRCGTPFSTCPCGADYACRACVPPEPFYCSCVNGNALCLPYDRDADPTVCPPCDHDPPAESGQPSSSSDYEDGYADGHVIYPCNTPGDGIVVPVHYPLAAVQRFGPLSAWAICYCQCPHAPHGCKNEVSRMDNSIYCDFCFFEAENDEDHFCDCDCSGCIAPCAREDCPCPASYNGRWGEYCCITCRDGQACVRAFHTRPSSWPPLGA